MPQRHRANEQPGDLSWDFRIPTATSGPEFGTRALASIANSRVCLTRHLPLAPFLTTSGVCTSDPFAAFFHAAPLMGFPSPVLERRVLLSHRSGKPEDSNGGNTIDHSGRPDPRALHPPEGGEARDAAPKGVSSPENLQMTRAAEAPDEHLVMPTFITGKPGTKEGHKAGP